MLYPLGHTQHRAARAGVRVWHRRIPRVVRAAAVLGLAFLCGARTFAEDLPARGLPFTRFYSLEDVGYGPRGASLGFDRFGRVAVIHAGVYAVLNDTVWTNVAERARERVQMANVIEGADGRMYFGARASWGLAEVQGDGLIHGLPLVPEHAPDWIQSTAFSDLIASEDGVYFIGPNGVVFRRYRDGETQFYPHSRIAHAFRVGRTVYISAFEHSLEYIDVEARTLKSASGSELDRAVVSTSTPLDERRALLSLIDGRLVVFDGQRLQPWEPQLRYDLTGRISTLLRLVDGNVAVGITGRGLFLCSPDGELILKLNTPEHLGITAMANREPGVLWLATEDGIEKLLYSSALTAFGQQLGLTVGWPIIERWKGSTFVASDGKLYRSQQGAAGAPTRFELYPIQPSDGVWALAAWDARLLIAGTERVYSVEPDGSFRPIAAVKDMAHLVMFDAEHCYAIGRTETALLEWRDGAWVETGPRAAGVTYPSMVHRVKNSVWIEMGGQVGRLWLQEGRLKLDLFPNASWTKRPWVNIGAIDHLVVFSAGPGERRFFDEDKGVWCDAPRWRRLLERSPYWVARLDMDQGGTIWATHDDGVVRFTPKGDDYEIDASTLDLINDRYPALRVLPGNDVWVFASQSLYHVERRWALEGRPAFWPRVVSLVTGRGEELLTDESRAGGPIRLPFAKNNLSFRFYSGSDAGRRAPTYEYRLTENEPWTAMAGSQLSFRGLHEGDYSLQVRPEQKFASAGGMETFAFEILPPWYRTWPAYLLFGFAATLVLAGVLRWSNYLERRRNRRLEQVVRDRTRQLETTMAKLGEETRNAATLAERDRLANEIHDSVQQGLTGAILQLDTTLKLPVVSGDVRSRLNVVRNMVSYARQEVQHAVWDMESPLLEGTELVDALHNLTAFLNADAVNIEVKVEGTPVPLGRTINHNLLRVAQEATTNAFRHAKADRISIQLEYGQDSVSLKIVDDGIGFRPNEVLQDRTGHLGLRGIRTRVKRMGGRLTIDSQPQQGTSVCITVPLQAAQPCV
ncbi:sensor histidine kinase [Opitutaceae bacterium EW11]|nr:sensor histidine kinase [Opitutaceae bacterium EW11]